MARKKKNMSEPVEFVNEEVVETNDFVDEEDPLAVSTMDAPFSDSIAYMENELEAEAEEPIVEAVVEPVPEPVKVEPKKEVVMPSPRPDDKKVVRLDGAPVSLKHIRDQQAANPNIRIVETNPGEYKTLQRMRG